MSESRDRELRSEFACVLFDEVVPHHETSRVVRVREVNAFVEESTELSSTGLSWVASAAYNHDAHVFVHECFLVSGDCFLDTAWVVGSSFLLLRSLLLSFLFGWEHQLTLIDVYYGRLIFLSHPEARRH